jgi:hypothetical protein
MIRRIVLLAAALGVLKLAVLFAHAALAVQFLIAAGLAAAWLLTLLVKPFGQCWLCRGKGNLRRPGSRRAPVCPLCHGMKRRQRTGSKTVHRVRRQVVAHWRGAR